MPKDFAGVMQEFQKGALHSGSKKGAVVQNPKQAKAIAISEDKKEKGEPIANKVNRAVKGIRK